MHSRAAAFAAVPFCRTLRIVLVIKAPPYKGASAG